MSAEHPTFEELLAKIHALEAEVTSLKAANALSTLQKAALESTANVIVITDAEGIIIWVNDAFTRLTGYSAPEAIGQTQRLTKSGMHDKAFYQELWTTIKNGNIWDGEIINRRKDGTLYYEHMTITPVAQGDLTPTHFIAVKQDITTRKQVERALQESEEQFRNLAEYSPSMIFIHSEGRTVYANQVCTHVLGYTKDEFYHPSFDFRRLIASDSIPTIEDAYRKHIQGEDVPPYEYGLITKSGERIDAINNPKLITFQGKTAILGVVTDITARVRAEQARKQSEKLTRVILSAIPDTLFRVSLDGIILDFPSREEGKLPGSAGKFVGKPISVLMPADQAETSIAFVRQAIQSQLLQIIEYRLDDEERNRGFFEAPGYFEARYIPYADDEVLVIIRNITERVGFEQQLQYMASHDALTQLPNRVLFRDRLDHALEMSVRHGEVVGVLLLDLDGFKNVNDTLGHDSGDIVLKRVATRLSNCIRESDTLARLGGDEFVFIIERAADPGAAAVYAEKILSKLAAPFQIAGRSFQLTASIGISLSGEMAERFLDSETMLKHADIAMYSVKNKAKNGYAFYNESLLG